MVSKERLTSCIHLPTEIKYHLPTCIRREMNHLAIKLPTMLLQKLIQLPLFAPSFRIISSRSTKSQFPFLADLKHEMTFPSRQGLQMRLVDTFE